MAGGITPKLGVKMSSTEAKAFIDGLIKSVIQRWDERVTLGQFMSRFVPGELPLSAIKLFFKNWGNFTVEINTLIAASYHKHIGFFKRHPDLLGPLGSKIADEFVHPKPPGHVLVMLKTRTWPGGFGWTNSSAIFEPKGPSRSG